MKLSTSIFLLIAAILILGGSATIIFFLQNQDIFTGGLDEKFCSQGGGNWNACGNKCEILNTGNPNVVCTQVCEQVCECGTITGLTCPDGFVCKTPKGISDALGYCKKE